MRNSFFFSKYRTELNRGRFNFPDAMVFVRCLEIHQKQRQNEVPWCRKTWKDFSDPQTTSSIQRNVFKRELAAILYKFDICIYINIDINIFIFIRNEKDVRRLKNYLRCMDKVSCQAATVTPCRPVFTQWKFENVLCVVIFAFSVRCQSANLCCIY